MARPPQAMDESDRAYLRRLGAENPRYRETAEYLQIEAEDRLDALHREHRATRLTIAAIGLIVILGGCGGAWVLARWWG